MKGIIFTEFMDHAESSHGQVFLDDLIETYGGETKGAYTKVGTYPCSELVRLISGMAAYTGDQVPDVIIGFGKQLAKTFKRDFPHYFETGDYFDFVEYVEQRIHLDVKKIYPDAELPRFVTIDRSEETLIIDYISARSLEHLALGLLLGTSKEFGETVSIEMSPFQHEGKRKVRFEITRSV